ncbi:SAM-dependent methyltransferase [Ruminococcus sp. AM27-11LB]|uniref:N-6 DNA methylase n=1 Tax=Mediterraneibacter TaxID=2316020 RepID=UPI000E4859A4|nr:MULTISPECIES: N-6 DNA methylase [Mediterraneibacter]RGH91611.1 SAM-dependent methyltransferase [Ruminococcus sp. AM27-11LB]
MAGKNERYAEELVKKEMKMELGINSFGNVYVQGEKCAVSAINAALKKAGGKPKNCELFDYTTKGTSKKNAMPEFVVTFCNDLNTIIVIECKKSTSQHESENRNQPSKYAVDGVLYYAKYLKEEFNVIAIAESGTDVSKMLVSTFYWPKNQKDFQEYEKIRNIILEPENYLKMINGEKIQKAYSLDSIQTTAANMHNSLRINKMTEKLKPLFVAGILLALQDESFCNDYDKLTSFSSLMNSCCTAIENVLDDGEIESRKIQEIKNKFKEIDSVLKLKATPLQEDNSLRWYIQQLEMKVKPMMDYVGNTVDALGIFYHEFISYSSGDGNSLGIVLTPQHLTEFMAELINIDKNSKVVDICCGSGAFLVTSMGKMFKQATTEEEIEYIRKNNLYGIEQDSDIHTLALANMIIRKDGKSHIIHGDCFDITTIDKLKNLVDTDGKPVILNKGLLNPPYSQKDHVELEFVEQELKLLCQGGELAVVCPMSCAIGTKYKAERTRIMENNTLKAVFSMPDDIFYGNNASTNVCVMVWEAGKKHDSSVTTFFGFCKDDGFVKRKKLGRIDAFGKWENIKKEWIRLYREKEEKEGMSTKAKVTDKDEWLCEAYMKTDFSKLSDKDFEESILDYLSYEIKNRPERVFRIGTGTDTNKSIKSKVKYGEFKVEDIFIIKNGKGITKEEISDFPGQIEAIQSGADNNAVLGKLEEEYCIQSGYNIIKEPCLSVARSGTSGYVAYHEIPCVIGDSAKALLLKDSSKASVHVYIYLRTILMANKYKYAYGRKVTEKKYYKDTLVLPIVKPGVPDWKYMNDYIKQLPYGDRL